MFASDLRFCRKWAFTRRATSSAWITRVSTGRQGTMRMPHPHAARGGMMVVPKAPSPREVSPRPVRTDAALGLRAF